MILLLDNYDSFTYNLYQFIAGVESEISGIQKDQTNSEVKVIRNDQITPEEILELAPEALVISPGPGKPSDAGICIEAIQKLKGKIPMLGVCLGHQAMAEAFGATVGHAGQLMHGKTSQLKDVKTDSVLFQNLTLPIQVARYHSLAVKEETLPEELIVTARSEDNEIMAMEHREYPIFGLQFHPESVMTPQGLQMIENFINYAKALKENEEMIKEAIIKLSKKENLTYTEAEEVMNEIMEGKASDVQKSAYLTALSMKGETIDEITASAAGMRAHCIKLLHDMDVLEIVGTGGDGANSFNISTTSSLVIAAAGIPVAKHGNRAASSKSGAADVLEALGVKIDVAPERSTQLLKDIQICFLFAQNYHIAMKYVGPIRKELGIRTVFNILGPLSNPAGANMELMGVYDESLVEPLARVMANLGVVRGMVVYGQDKLDEISMCAPTTVCEIKDGTFTSYEITPEQFGYERCEKGVLTGGTPQENAQITLDIISGKELGAKRNAVCLNAGAAIYLAGKADSIEAGVRKAEQIIDEGLALKKLEQFKEESNK